MVGRSNPKVGRAFIAWVKIGFYEITSLVSLSVAFWLATLPLVSIGAALLALFTVVRDSYDGTAPTSEWHRLRSFGQSFRANLVRGLPLSIVVVFVFVNTYVYFVIGVFGQDLQFVVGGIVGTYLCLLGTLFVLRVANVVIVDDSGLRTAVRTGGRSCIDNLDYTILQAILSILLILTSFALLPAVFLLLPAAIALLEIVFYDEASGADPRSVLTRYEVDT